MRVKTCQVKMINSLCWAFRQQNYIAHMINLPKYCDRVWPSIIFNDMSPIINNKIGEKVCGIERDSKDKRRICEKAGSDE